MPDTTPNLALELLDAGQAQKHVTANAAIMAIDALLQIGVESRAVTSPPGSPVDGQRWIVPSGASGAWSGETDHIAAWQDGAWVFYTPQEGWIARIKDEGRSAAYTATGWHAYEVITAHGASFGLAVREQELTLSGAFVETSGAGLIPNRGVVVGVSTRTTQAVTGASSYDCGLSGEVNKFGGSLGAALNSTNIGVIGPTAFYSDTAVRLTANGSNFTGGKVRVAIHYLALTAPAN